MSEKAEATPAMVLPLTKKVVGPDGEISELKFREPTGLDILNVGNPVIFDVAFDPPRITHDARRMQDMISRLALVPPSAVAQMAPRDLVSAMWLITPFFVPLPGMI